MARVTTTEVDAWRTCGRPRYVDAESWEDDTVLEKDCPGYTSQAVRALREEVSWTFADLGAQPTPGMDTNSIERSSIRLVPVDGDWSCPHCGFEQCAFSDEPRRPYRRLSDQDPDELIRRARMERQGLSAAERQAAALEKLVAQGDQGETIRALQAQLDALNARLDENPKPKARA